MSTEVRTEKLTKGEKPNRLGGWRCEAISGKSFCIQWFKESVRKEVEDQVREANHAELVRQAQPVSQLR